MGFLREKATDDQWRELIILAAGVARPKEAATLLRGLVGRGQKLKRAELRHRVLLLAIACLETCVDLDAATRAYVIDQVRSIFPPKDDDEARLVAAAGDPAVSLLKFNPALAPSEAVACVRALAQIGSTAAMQALSEYMAHSANEVIEAIVDAWDLFDRTEYARQVLAQSTSLVIPRLTSWEGFEQLRRLNALAIGELAPDVDLEPLRQCVALTTLSLGAEVPIDSFRITLRRRARLQQQFRHPDQAQVAETNEPLALIDLAPVAGLSALKHVSLSHPRIIDLSPLAALTNLTELYVIGSSVSDLSPLAALASLTRLKVSGQAVSDLSPLAALTNLTWLEVESSAVSDLSPLAALTNLTWLSTSGAMVSDLSLLATLTNLTQLYMGSLTIGDLSPLVALTNLTRLAVSGSTVSDLSPLTALTNLTRLYVYNSTVSDLSPLAALTNLTGLYVIDSPVSDLSPLAALTNLTQLYVYNSAVSDLSPLAALTNLTELYVRGNKLLDQSQINKITARMPHLEVIGH